jgi:aryl-alcohol dehydrogenase-like predicted oxidoreductase
MRRVKLGRTGLEVSQLGLGGLFVASCLADYAQARAAVRTVAGISGTGARPFSSARK